MSTSWKIVETPFLNKMQEETGINMLATTIEELGDKFPVNFAAMSKKSLQLAIDELEKTYLENILAIIGSPFNQSYLAKTSANAAKEVQSLKQHNEVMQEEIEQKNKKTVEFDEAIKTKKAAEKAESNVSVKDVLKKEIHVLMKEKSNHITEIEKIEELIKANEAIIEKHLTQIDADATQLQANLVNIDNGLEFMPWYEKKILILKKYRDAATD